MSLAKHFSRLNIEKVLKVPLLLFSLNLISSEKFLVQLLLLLLPSTLPKISYDNLISSEKNPGSTTFTTTAA